MKKKLYSIFCIGVTALILVSCKKKEVEMSKAFIKYYGSIEKDQGVDMAITSDGGYVILGTTDNEGNGGTDMLVIRIDNEGNEVWHKTLGDKYDDKAGGIEVTADGGFIVVGTISYKDNVFDPREDSTKLYAARLNSSGSLLRDTVFDYLGSGAGPGEIQIGTQGVDVQISGSNYIFTGIADRFKAYDLYAVMTDDNFNRINSLEDFFQGADLASDDFPGRVAVTSGGEFVLCSSTNLGGTDADYTARVIQFNLNSGYLTQNNAKTKVNFNADASLGFARDIIQTGGDNYVMVGSTYNIVAGNAVEQDIYFMKLNSTLDPIGTIEKFGESGSKEKGVSVTKTSDGGYIILGTTNNESYIGAPEKKTDILVIKVNSNGKEEWKKTFGGIGDDDAITIKQTSDGGYAICGTIDFGNNSDNSNRSYAIALIKINEEGEIANTK